MKNQIDRLNATPSKRLYLSIIADYDLNRSICELVDNALDVWTRSGRTSNATIKVNLNIEQQTIGVEDDAGGLPRSELVLMVGPGQTGTSPTDETIGIFGVGTKRAVVALAQDVRITTRFGKRATYQVEFDDRWLEDEDWDLPVYEVDNVSEGSTVVNLQRLRIHIDNASVEQLGDHLSTTYARFLEKKCLVLEVNGKRLTPRVFDNWAYPPSFGPRRYIGVLRSDDNRMVRVEAFAGLARESSPAAGEYGVYFYCNDRLIARAMKSFDVGFIKGFAGLPHPKVSLTRVLVYLNGDARAMPWNSSKSDINTRHTTFLALQNWLTQVVKDYASLSRIWMGEWPDKVFAYTDGKIEDVQVDDFPQIKRSFLPPLPRSRPRYGEKISQKNRSVANKKPWTKGLYEGIVAADLIWKQRQLEQRNRIALIVLDSTLEIGFKEYLVNESGTTYSDKKLLDLFSNRANVESEVKKYVTLKADVWGKIAHYYRLRCKLVHERATVGISDAEIEDFRRVVERVLAKLHKLAFSAD